MSLPAPDYNDIRQLLLQQEVVLSSLVKHSPELELLIALARVELPLSDRSRVNLLLSRPIDEDRLLVLAAGHGLEPMLFHHLSSPHSAKLPESAMQTLRQASRITAQRAMILASRLQAISDHLEVHKIKHAIYKGPLFAETYYGNCALRVFHDLDVIVSPESLLSAQHALSEMGFVDKYGLSDNQQAASFRFGSQHLFTSSDALDLDLHWRIVPKSVSRSLDVRWIWQRVSTVPFLGHQLPTLCPEDMLVVLCLHAGQHEWARLSTLCDIAQLFASHPQLNWDIVRSHLRDSNTTRMVYVSLYLLSQNWTVHLPPDLAAGINADPTIAEFAAKVQSELWPAPELEPSMQSNFSWLLARTKGEALGDRLRFLAGNILGPTLIDFEVFNLPRFLFSLYPTLRALRLAFKYVTKGTEKAHA
jgi:hypothetical protein